jgi:hypothetical protein
MSQNSYFIASPVDANAQILPQKRNVMQEIPATFKKTGIHEFVPFGQVPCVQQSERCQIFPISNIVNTPTLFQSTSSFTFRLPKSGVNWINSAPVLEILYAVANGTAVTFAPMSHHFTVIECTDASGTVLYRWTKETLLLLNLILCQTDAELLSTQAGMLMSDKVPFSGGRSYNGVTGVTLAGYLPLRGLFEAMSIWYVSEGMLLFNFYTSSSIVSAGTNTNITVTGGNMRIYTELYAKGNPQATKDAQYFSSNMNTTRLYQLRMLPVDPNRAFTASTASSISTGNSIGARRVHGIFHWSVATGYTLSSHGELNLVSFGQQGKILIQTAAGDALAYSAATSDDYLRNVDWRASWGNDLACSNQMKTGKALYFHAFDWDIYKSITQGMSRGQISLDGQSALSLVITPSAAYTAETFVVTPTGTATSGQYQLGYKDDWALTPTNYNDNATTAVANFNAIETVAAEGIVASVTSGTTIASGAVTYSLASPQKNEYASGRIKRGLPWVMSNTMTTSAGAAVTLAITTGTYGVGGFYSGGVNLDTYICVVEELYLSQYSSGIAVRAPPLTYDSLTS